MKKLLILMLWLTTLSVFGQTTKEKAALQQVTGMQGVRLLTLPDGSVSEAFLKIIEVAASKIPSMAKTEFLANPTDSTTKVVLLREPLNSRYYTYVYTGDTTSTTSDKDGQFDGYRRIVINKRVFEIQESVIDVGQFGAKGDGIQNDFPAWQRAISYLKGLSKAPTLIATGAAYEFASGNLIIDKAKISIYSNGSAIENGQISFSSATWGQEYSATISGLNFKYDSFTKNTGSDRSGRFGVYIKNVTRVKILDNTFENVNAGVYFEPTGYKQGVKTIKILGNKFGKSNYGIWIPKVTDEVYATVPSGNNKSTRLVGDISVIDNEFRGPELIPVKMYGIDGIQFHNNLIFMPNYLNSAGFASKLENFDCEGCTYMNITGNQFFEAGRDGVRLTNCDLVVFSNNHIALPGQTWSGSAIHIIQTSAVADATKYFVSFNFSNNTIDGGTEKAVYLEGTEFPTTGYKFTNMHIRRIFQSGVYYGDDGDITPTRPLPAGVPKYTLYAEKGFNNVIWEADVDQYNSDRHYISYGQGGRFHEGNAYNNTEAIGTSINPSGISDFTAKDDKEYVLENRFPYSSSGFNGSVWSKNNITAKDTTVAVGPRGTLNAPVGKLTATSTSGTHYISTAGSMAVAKTAGDSSAWTFSGYFKAPANSTRPVVSIMIAGGFTSSKGVQIVFDAKTGDIGYAKGTTFGGYTSDGMYIRSPKVTKAEDGWWKVVVSWLPAASSTSTNVRIHMAEKMSPVGSFTYAGDADAVVLLGDLQLSNTSIEVPHSPTTGAAVTRTAINYSGGSAPGATVSTLTDPTQEIVYENDGTGNFTSYVTNEQKFPRFTENLIINSGNMSSGTWSKQTGSGVTAVTNAPISAGGRGTAYKFAETNTSNLQRGIFQATAIAKADSAITYNYSFSAKSDSIKHINVTLTNNGFSGGASVDLNIEKGRLIRINPPSGGYLVKSVRVRTTNNGYRRYSINYLSPAGANTIRTAVFLKPTSAHVGNAAYTPSGASAGTNGFYLADQLLTQSDEEWPYVSTGATAAPRKAISYSGIVAARDTTGKNTIYVDADGLLTITPSTPALTYVFKPQHVQNLLQGSNQLSTTGYIANTGSTDLGIVAVNDTLGGPAGKGKIFRVWDKTNANVTRAFWNSPTVTKSALALNYTGSFEAKAGEMMAVHLRFSTESGTGAIGYDIDLVNPRVIRTHIVTGTYTYVPVAFVIEKLDNGFYRYSATFTSPANAPNVRMWLYTKPSSSYTIAVNHNANAAYSGTIGNRMYMARWQLSQSSIPLDYTENVGATTTTWRYKYFNGVQNITGATNQITVSPKDSAGGVGLALPQNIGPASNVGFAKVTATITDGAAGGLELNTPTTGVRAIMRWLRNLVGRWEFGANATAESSNSGSDMELTSRNDDGTFRQTVIRWLRGTGRTVILGGLSIDYSTVPQYADNAAAVLGGLEHGRIYRNSSNQLFICNNP